MGIECQFNQRIFDMNSSFSTITPNLQFLPIESLAIKRLMLNMQTNEKGCWIPSMVPNAKGYCYISIGGRKGTHVRIHRFMWERFNGLVPKGLFVLHKQICTNRVCCNPEHLYLGTAAQNTRDMLDQNRQSNGNIRKVSASDVTEMEALELLGYSNVKIAKELNISHETVRVYLNGTKSVP